MAITKTIQATVKNRTDTAANWTSKNPVLAEGEIIVVQTNAGETRLKIGDGVKTFTQLPYIDEQIYNNVVTSVNGQTGDVTLDISGGGTGNMKKLTFTGTVTGEYDGTTDVNINIPIATASTAGTIKVGNGLSISADGTLSVTTATYYTGTADPVNTLGADGDLYLKTEG